MNLFLNWLDDRTGLVTGFGKLKNAEVPPGKALKLIPTAIIWAFFLQAATGIVLWLYYTPSTSTAWESIYYIQHYVPGGWLVRGVHHYSAQVLIALLGIHVMSLIFTGRYRKYREFVLWTTMIMFCICLGSCLTGDLLTWSISGYSSTKVRLNLLQMLPFGIGDWLLKLAIGGPGPLYGTMTLTRFLLLHILVCGGGFFGVACIWRWCEQRARKLELPELKEAKKPYVPYWSNEVIKSSLTCLAVTGIIMLLVYHKPLCKEYCPESAQADQIKLESAEEQPPVEGAEAPKATEGDKPVESEKTVAASPPALPEGPDFGTFDEDTQRKLMLGPEMFAPADPATSYDAARPEWPFRALYYFANMKTTTVDEKGETQQKDVFPADKKYIPIFVITSAIAFFFFLVPFIGKHIIGHGFNVVATIALFGAVCYLTYDSFKHDAEDSVYKKNVIAAETLYHRSLELAQRPEGIPPIGLLSVIRQDPKIQGPKLFALHCASCHAFEPQPGQSELAEFPPIRPDSPDYSAPNLYDSASEYWIAGFMDPKRIRSEHYFGKTAFARGSMDGYTQETLKEMLEFYNDLHKEDEEETSGDEVLATAIRILYEESQLDTIRPQVDGGYANLAPEEINYFEADYLNCTECHKFYSDTKQKTAGPDLRGYMSREWIAGIIANPAGPRFYGKDNDRMPAYHANPEDATMTMEEIGILADWLHGKWYRPAPKVEE